MKIRCAIFAIIAIQLFPSLVQSEGVFSEAFNYVSERYIRELSEEELQIISDIKEGEGTDEEKIIEMTRLLDCYSTYYTAEYCRNLENAGNTSAEPDIYGFSAGNDYYIIINSFSTDTGKKFEKIYSGIDSGRVYIDLCNCGGGFISSMREVAGQIVPKGKLCKAVFREREKVYSLENEVQKRDLYIIVSNKTASSAEILASAVLESGAGKILGYGCTYGKTEIQELIMLSNGGVLKLTEGKYYTRDGKDISGKGIMPQYELMSLSR